MKVHNFIVSTLLTISHVFIHSGILASDFTGHVVSFLDGETIEVLHKQNHDATSVPTSAVDTHTLTTDPRIEVLL